MIDMKEMPEEPKKAKPKGRGSATTNYMNLYLNQSGRNSDNKNYPVQNTGIKYENLKPKKINNSKGFLSTKAGS